MTAAGRLAAALAAEYAAIYAYGRIGVYLDSADQKLAHDAETAHRDRRDALLDALAALDAPAPAAKPGYELPAAVIDDASALAVAIEVEDAVAATWRAALAETSGDQRRLALTGYQDAAVQATRWRRRAHSTPLTSAFPERPS